MMIQTLETGKREEDRGERIEEGIHNSGLVGQSEALARQKARCAVRFCRRDGMLVRAMWNSTNSKWRRTVAAAIMSASQMLKLRRHGRLRGPKGSPSERRAKRVVEIMPRQRRHGAHGPFTERCDSSLKCFTKPSFLFIIDRSQRYI